MATTPVSVRLDEPLKARVRSLADQRRRPVHWLMREAIEQYVTREEQREAFRQTLHAMQRRLQLLLNLPPEKLQKNLLQETARSLSSH